ncbi:uncharacterized protein METZ01_LOCUS272314 [marine metagenome]|uniref:Uncharacterized protein n=1 Tax=marine metagenome TaxID=408172 RepID=A0A382K4T5_9ZZZZ
MYGIHDVLKPAGECLFIKNMNGIILHQYLRKRYGAGKNMWYYLSLKDFSDLSKPFKFVKYRTFGFLGFGDYYLKGFRSKFDYYFYTGIYKK